MLKYYSAAFTSMLRSGDRVQGRPWLAELIARTLKIILSAPENKDLSRLRRVIDAAGGYHPAVSKVTCESKNIAGVPCLELTPPQASNTVIVYLHGGGYVFGSTKGYKPLLAQLSVNSQAMVVGVDYRLSPEHPYPAAQDDCLAVAQAVFAEHSNSKKILAGDSAGGALCVATVLELNAHQPSLKPDACVLISPWVDPLASDDSMRSNQAHDFLTAEFLQNSISDHLQDTKAGSKVRFNEVDLTPLPRTLVQSGDAEIFASQIARFVGRAHAAGVNIEHQVSAAQFHVFQLLSPVLKEARLAVKNIATFINSV